MNSLYEPVLDIAQIDIVKKELEKEGGRTAKVSGCIDTQKVHLASALSKNYSFQLIVASDEIKARKIAEDGRFFNSEVVYYPPKDVIFFNADVSGRQISGQRIKCIAKIIEKLNKSDRERLTVVTTIDGLSDLLIPIDKYEKSIIELKIGSTIDTEELSKDLVSMGFQRFAMVEARGQFAIRGGIIDIFSYTDDAPVRIELWDDEVDSIRSFDVDSQRSIENLKEYTVFPATEFIFSEEEIDSGIEKIRQEKEEQLKKFNYDKKKKTKEEIEACNHLNRMVADMERTGDYSKFIYTFADRLSCFAEYFPKGDTLIVLDEPSRLFEHSQATYYEYSESMKNRLETGYVLPSQTHQLMNYEDTQRSMDGHKQLVVSTLDYSPVAINPDISIAIETRGISSYNNSFELLAADLKKYKKNHFSVLLVCSSRTRATRIVDDLGQLGIESFYSEDLDKCVGNGLIVVTYGSLHKGFEYPLQKFVCIAENDIFTEKRKKKLKKVEYDGKKIQGFNELNIGDYVVHENYGVGEYKGIEKIKVEGTEKDYIKISYANNSSLYILATQLDRLQKYADSDVEKKPKLNKIGGQEWGKTKAKVNSAVEEIAKDLVELYAKRQTISGYKFAEDTVWQREFEEMFPYEETGDQLRAIEDTKADMESIKVMDRLICGDVGYGKTEIAIRAAFKAVQEGKQVAYLVPTTVLASQHYSTFVQRMKDFPVTIGQLSSFRTTKENKKTIEELKKGLVDVVIGTHRLLSKDVEFKDLGLLIIDEEQRFGVSHKEKIKKMRNNVDVLTLSATPIPRTLHMSLSGIRDMSVLEEPPVDRVPIQTFVTEYNEELIREAINRELARNGQVFYVYNKVRDIEDITLRIQNLVPDAVVTYAHGQMDKRDLERIMYNFVNGEIDVLVSTTIIETGMDISNCNTMLIHDADKFGLSQLYQLRGRVGRSSRTAYAFLLYRRDKILTEVAEKRLSAIKEFADFGSGFKIAMKDLEIRGAGNVLGNTQHGHMAAVGYDLYCKMLNTAVQNLKGIKTGFEFETTIDLEVDAFIPSTYIKSEFEKLDIYKRIAALENMAELSDMRDELMDRYGSIPTSAENLLMIAVIKAKAHKIGIIEMKGGVRDIEDKQAWKTVMTVYPNANLDPDEVSKLIKDYGGAIQMRMNANPAFVWTVTKKKFTNAKEYLIGLNDLMDVFEDRLLNCK